jgi:glycosyltransferase involved in cell wall biosynthesis
VVLTVGRLSREKAQSDLLVAFKQLLDQYPDLPARLVVVGDGPERAKLETTVNGLGIKERVNFTGQVSDVMTYYALAGVFALPSHSEGSPIVVLEAMAANVPIVATAVGGVPEILVHNESALLVPPSNPTAMAEAIALIWKDKELAERLTRASAALVASRFTPESYVESLIQIYGDFIE